MQRAHRGLKAKVITVAAALVLGLTATTASVTAQELPSAPWSRLGDGVFQESAGSVTVVDKTPTEVEARIADEALELINLQREYWGLSPLRDWNLEESVTGDPGWFAAQWSAEEMAVRGDVGHWAPRGFPYTSSGAYYPAGGSLEASSGGGSGSLRTAALTIASLFNSEPHQRILTQADADAVSIGVACVQLPGGLTTSYMSVRVINDERSDWDPVDYPQGDFFPGFYEMAEELTACPVEPVRWGVPGPVDHCDGVLPFPGVHRFRDVDRGSYAYVDVGCLAELGVTTGTSSSTFSPAQSVTREQMAAFLGRLYRSMTGAECSAPDHGFTDVAATSFANDDIACIKHLGVTTGTSSSTFSPAQSVTREQMAAFLGRLYTAVVARWAADWPTT